MSKMLKVTPNDNYTLLVEFENGNKIIFNMRDLIKTIPYSSLANLNHFKDITLEEKAIRWPDPIQGQRTMLPIRLTVGQHAVCHKGIRRKTTNDNKNRDG